MMTDLTWRQLRLLDWLREPQHPDLPTGPAIDWHRAMWRVSDLVRLSGVAKTYTYARCRRDLVALHREGLVDQVVPGRWYLTDGRLL